ncbi:hypothetical protein D3C76_1877900 [compost metagenome]
MFHEVAFQVRPVFKPEQKPTQMLAPDTLDPRHSARVGHRVRADEIFLPALRHEPDAATTPGTEH